MERATVMKTFHGSQRTPKSSTLGDRDASFSSYLSPEDQINCQRHLTIGPPGRCRALDDFTSELSIFDAHKYFNEVTNNDIQKLTISSNTRVSSLVNMSMEHNAERGDIITETSRYSSASSSVDGYASIRNYRARSFHAATPTASSEASWNSQTGLLSHPAGATPVSMGNFPHAADPNKKIKASFSKPIWLFCRKCPCSGKKSVQVRGKNKEPKAQMPQSPSLPRLSHNQIVRDSLNLERQDVDSINPNIPKDKLTINMETTTAAVNNPETHKIPINPNNWVDQRPQSQDREMFVAKSQRFQPAEKNQVPATLQSQRVMASVRPFIEGFTFPVLKPQSANSTIKLQVANGVNEDPPRESLEVYRPPDLEPTPFSRKPVDKDRQTFSLPPSPKSRIVDDDVASDASSDLFEIESFSTLTTSACPIMYRRRDSMDEASNFDSKRLGTTNHSHFLGMRSTDESMTPTIAECYEPSEASIDWSVNTAEGLDRASDANFCVSASETADDTSMIQGDHCGHHPPEKCKRRSSSGSGLLSCRCEKAVSVGPQPVKCVPAAEGHKGATALTSRHVSSWPAASSIYKPPLGRSQTARLSLPFAA